MSSDLRRFVDQLDALGCKVDRARSNHLRIRVPSGRLVFTSSTPSDHRSWKNALAQVRREIKRESTSV